MLNFNLPCGVQSLALTYKEKPDLGSWFLLSSHFSCNIHKNAEIFLDITNVLDVEYEEIAGIPQPRRSFAGGIRFQW
jgi:outer membrane cobalamin receptor